MKRIPVKKTIIVLFFLFLVSLNSSYATPPDFSGEWHRSDGVISIGLKIIQDDANVAVLDMDARGSHHFVRAGRITYLNVLTIAPYDDDWSLVLSCNLTMPEQMVCNRVGEAHTESYSRIKKY